MTTANIIKERLDAAIAPHRLLEHPFYRSWRAGTLPVAALATYAAEYGSLIEAVDSGWEMVAESEHAAEEREHSELWARFAAHLGTSVTTPQIPAVAAMLATARRLFSAPETAWGALYAFEAQQPDTAAEKLLGLTTHYGFDAAAAPTEYFRVHAGAYDEAEMIVSALEGYGGEAPAVAACAEMSAALWDALTGIHEKHC